MSIGTAEYEEWAVAQLEELAQHAEDYVQGRSSRATLAGSIGQARDLLREEMAFQWRENGVDPYA